MLQSLTQPKLCLAICYVIVYGLTPVLQESNDLHTEKEDTSDGSYYWAPGARS